MKFFPIFGLTLLLASPVIGEGVRAIAQTPQTAPVAQPTAKAQVELQLAAAKKLVTKNEKGETVVSWKPLAGQVAVKPGDVLRYTVTGNNTSDRPANNLVVTQPIPAQTVYNLNSANFGQGAGRITYSLDKGKTFVDKPMVQVKLANGTLETRPAPAKLYTHVRWQFSQPIVGRQSISAVYEVTIR
jgi:uncharacterized repeat protein (TIGR01451 family)